MRAHLECVECGEQVGLKQIFRCDACGGNLSIEYDIDTIRSEFLSSWRRSGGVFERFGVVLPERDREHIVSLGEGITPMIRARRLASELGIAEVFLKLEGMNPTHSFKDRQVATAMTAAAAWGSRKFAIVSSGNAGIALAAYAAHTGQDALIWVAGDSPEEKLANARMYGPRVFSLPDPNGPEGAAAYWGAIAELHDFSLFRGLVPMASARSVNPYMVEGVKPIAFEILADLDRSPDWVFAPVGGGGLVGGLWKGFVEAAAMGATSSRPRIGGGQRTAYFVPIDAMDDSAYDDPRFYRPLDGAWAFESIQDSGGLLVRLEDHRIRAAQTRLALTEGVFAEPRGAFAVAALMEALESGELDGSERVVCVISGSGLKDMATARQLMLESPYELPIPVSSLQEGWDVVGF